MLRCTTCTVIFEDEVNFKAHHKSEWHIYNLKRKISNLKPIKLDAFEQFIAASNAEPKKDENTFCVPCKKAFNSVNAFEAHLSSKRHKINAKDFEGEISKPIEEKNKDGHKKIFNDVVKYRNTLREDDWESCGESDEEMEDAEEESDADDDDNTEDEESDVQSLISHCLFCGRNCTNLSNNLRHMSKKHSFFVPFIEYLVDLKSLIKFLGEKVSMGHMCLWCNDRSKMYLSTTAAHQHMQDKEHCKLRLETDGDMIEYADFYDFSSMEDVNEGLDDACEDGDENFSLTLRSGATIGHRSLKIYYDQKLAPIDNTSRNARIVNKIAAKYRGLGWTGTWQGNNEKIAKDINRMKRLQSKQHMQLGVHNNKQQHYFRRQVMF